MFLLLRQKRLLRSFHEALTQKLSFRTDKTTVILRLSVTLYIQRFNVVFISHL